jgi:hypothetical protein
MITDPFGRRLGYTSALGEINEIPNAFYSGNGNIEQFLVPNPVAGTYQIDLVGLNSQVYGAMSSRSSVEDINMVLGQDETNSITFTVEVQVGTPGDINRDGCINEQDATDIQGLINTFTNPNDPGDIDGDGVINQSDVNLLDELIAQELPCATQNTHQVFLPVIIK